MRPRIVTTMKARGRNDVQLCFMTSPAVRTDFALIRMICQNPACLIAADAAPGYGKAMRWMFVFASLSGFIAIAIGAWTAHGADMLLGPEKAGWVRTGVEYQATHSLALLAVGIMMSVRPGRFLGWSGTAFAIGIVLFSGGLYGLALTDFNAFAYATPLGGVALITGWLLLAIYALALDRHAP